MKFCTKCGKQLSDDAKFCDTCGASVSGTQTPPPIPGTNENVADDTKRKEVFVGVKRKCPVCGEPVESFTYKCEGCGYEFTDVKLSKRLSDFQEGFVKYEGEAQRNFITSFEVPNTREDIGNFLIMIYSILKTDLQNGADRDRVGSLVSLFNRIINQINLILEESNPIRIDAEKKLSSLKIQMESYEKLLEENNKMMMKLYKKQNKFKNKHPVMHRFFIIGIIVALVFVAIPAGLLISEGTRSAAHKGIVITIEKENITLPYQIDEYFEVVSDGTITTYDYKSDYKVEFEVKNIKTVPNDFRLGYFIYLNDDNVVQKNLESQFRSIKNGSSRKIVIEKTGYTSDASWDFIKNLERADSLSLSIQN